MLSTALPNETTEVKTTILKTDQIISLPLILEMDDPTHFHGELKFRYNTPTSKLNDSQQEKLKNLGFKNHFIVTQNQTQLLYPYSIIRFNGSNLSN
jgi:hypothetical protein